MTRIIEIDDQITVGALAEELAVPVSKLITELFKNGVMATVNEKIDFDTAQITVAELGLEVELARKKVDEQHTVRQKRQLSDKAEARPPVVAVMGHVDHGKTSLLDAIREADTVKGEAGGITQHISAYQIIHDNRKLTLLDTPGHEAFAALREHGAQLTDLVIIVIAADDGIKPQTLEAIRFANKAGVKMIIAVNKIDKPDSDINRIKQQLAENELLIEEWGGDVILMPVSAKTHEGIKELLDMILLVADVEELKAEVSGPAEGLIIESHMEQGRGPVAIALVEHGNIAPGNFVTAGSTYAKVRNLESTDGKALKSAGPSTPVVITGFKALPEFADQFKVVADEKTARALTHAYIQSIKASANTVSTSSELLRIIDRTSEMQELNIIVKADVQGSLTSVIDSLKALDTDEVAVRVVSSGIGVVSENDIHTAHSTSAIIYGFNTSLPTSSRQLASRDKVSVRLYKVIYELIDDVKSELESLLSPEIIETEVGTLTIKGIFKTSKTELICGGEVTSGKVTVPALARIYRKKELIGEDIELVKVQRGQQETKEVFEGDMCGLNLATKSKLILEEGDKVTFYTRQAKQRTL